MDARKDISDMSFEEFFSEQKVKKEKESARVEAAKAKKEASKGDHQPGFQGSGPKLNFIDGRVMVYIPRYTASENSRFEVAVEVGEDVATLGRLDSVKQKSNRVSRPDTKDITGAGVKPFGGFIITIDGEKVFEQKPCDMLYFNNMGSAMRKPFGEVYAICEPGSRLKISRAEVIDETERNGLMVVHANVQATGGIWIDDSNHPAEEEAEEPEAAAEEPAKEAPKAKPAKKKPAKKAKGEIALPAGLQDADVVFEGEVLALYDSMPVPTVSVEGADPSECEVRVERAGVAVLAPVAATERINARSDDLWGPIDVSLVKGGKALTSKRVFVIPGFSCEYAGKGDLTQDTAISYSVFGQEGECDAFDGDSQFEHEGFQFAVRWAVPAVTYDIGSGPVKVWDGEINASDIKGGKMVIDAKGARKKGVFFGGETGKKRELASNWEGDTVELDMAEVIDEIYSNPSAKYCLYITVNSFPNKRFLVVKNPERISVSFSDGVITVEADGSVTECVCRLYSIDRTESDIPVPPGTTSIPVPDDIIEAEVIETNDGKVRVAIPVAVRQLPFVLRDETNSIWLYVSKSKRLPLPDNLFADGKPDEKAIKAWHERIVRMNPEMKSMPLPTVIAAFKAFSQRAEGLSILGNKLYTTSG